MVLIISTGSFPLSGLDRIHGWWCDKGCGPPVSSSSARNPSFMDFATLRAQSHK